MNTNNVKKYAPKARKAFIEAMSKQAAKYGITKKKIEQAEQKGDLVLIGDRPFPASVIKPRERLVKRIEQQGFDQVMEHVAYSWFNRLCAIRYMERKGFLDHGRRVLSAADGSAGVPQILEECLDVELPGLDQAKVRELKLDGTKDEELYRELLLAQCHVLHQAMPFLFEAVADESELLLPENLTKTDSLIRDLVASVPDEDWEHIEIIGWLYQFYISEKKDQVMGKVVKSEDIPAATQLFTPNWIVQYLVQNSVGRQWLQTYPDSPLKEKMPYYIEPAEQTPEVQAQLEAMTPKELKPESLSCIDPAVGSGHLLIEAYKVFKAIYEERGYRTRDIPQLILENNLFGLDIDDRAGQLAGFALMMLAREDDRRIFSRNIRLNVLSLQESSNVNLPSIWRSLNLTGEWQSGTSQGLFEEEQQDLSAFEADNRYQLLQKTLERFKQAKTFGSLIDVPHEDYEGLKELFVTLCELEGTGDSMQKAAASQLIPHVQQAVLLAQKYDAVIANPPYMGSKGMNAELKEFAKKKYPNSKSDLFAVFMERAFGLTKNTGFNAQVNMQAWMFISRFENLRNSLLSNKGLLTLAHFGAKAFSQISGEVVQTCAWIMTNNNIKKYHPTFFGLTKGNESQKKLSLAKRENKYTRIRQEEFSYIPGEPIAYWVPEELYSSYARSRLMSDCYEPREGLATGNNDIYVRFWHEVATNSVARNVAGRDESKSTGCRWFPYNKGGEKKRWYGNDYYVVDWKDDGYVLQTKKHPSGSRVWAHNFNLDFIFRPMASWSDITSKGLSARFFERGYLFDATGLSAFDKDDNVEKLYIALAICNSTVGNEISKILNPTLHFKSGDFARMALPNISDESRLISLVAKAVEISKIDFNLFEDSWGFCRSPLINNLNSVSESFANYLERVSGYRKDMVDIEHEIDELCLESFGLKGAYELDVAEPTLLSNPSFRIGSEFRSESLSNLISYSVGCIMGRYSLDRDGIVFGQSGNEGFYELVAEGAYKTFPADDDGIIPLTDQEWFPDDATNRFREFVKVVWGEERLQENLDFVAESLCLHAIKPKKSESSMETIRRYLSTQFYKDHLKTYKKRPIYWLFSSGKQKAFECLVYLHRYNEGTLARMRTEYVIPLTAKMAAYAQKLENDKEASGSAAEVKRLEKEIAQLHKQQAELSEFDEKLRHYADQRISLDLDDGVKANYGKFGDLLAEVKAITGEAPEALS